MRQGRFKMKRIHSISLLLALAGSLSNAAPVITDVAYRQDSFASRTVTVTYTLSGEDAIVTADVLTNGVSIGAENVTELSGDVNCAVSAGERSFTWQADKSWPDHKITTASVQFRLTAWTASRPPAYLVADLAGTEGVRYFTSTNALPYGGLTNDLYRTRYMAFRRIDAAGVRWTMGESLFTDTSGNKLTNPPHDCTLTNDFYLGVFEVTQGQWYRLMGAYPSTLYTGSDRDFCPAENVCHIDMRGDSAFWPAAPAEGSFLYAMRQAVGGGLEFDLPSEAQWEFAGRANHFGKRNGDGSQYVETNLLQIANYTASGNGHPIPVGSLKPNDFGLYDMQGNVWEWCLDKRFTDDTHTVSNVWGDVAVDDSVVSFVVRGGCFYSGAADVRLARRGGANEDNRDNGSRGFRVAVTIR